MRVDKPLPGDLVIRRRLDGRSLRDPDVYVLTHWPDTETVVAGPYQSLGYALRQAQERRTDRSIYVWRDHATGNGSEELEDVTPD